MDKKLDIATFAGGCFWCTEAIFKRLRGVEIVESGYTGGTVENPTYEKVCSGKTGHAESIQVTFDPQVITYEKLLEIFWRTHNPTTLNQQGNDIGTQYRSAIFYHCDMQRKAAEELKNKLQKETYKDKIVTEIVPFTNFYKAEEYHQNYYDRNKQYPYCQYIIDPKIQKLMREFSSDVKEMS